MRMKSLKEYSDHILAAQYQEELQQLQDLEAADHAFALSLNEGRPLAANRLLITDVPRRPILDLLTSHPPASNALVVHEEATSTPKFTLASLNLTSRELFNDGEDFDDDDEEEEVSALSGMRKQSSSRSHEKGHDSRQSFGNRAMASHSSHSQAGQNNAFLNRRDTFQSDYDITTSTESRTVSSTSTTTSLTHSMRMLGMTSYSSQKPLVTCVVCTVVTRDAHTLDCKHVFCDVCLGQTFLTALNDRSLMPVTCCKKEIDQSLGD
eukprot:gene42116-52212_t